VLAGAGAEAIVIACNTAHHWYDDLARASTVPILHIADAACAEIADGARVGLLGTEAVLHSEIYQERLVRRAVEPLVNAPDLRAASVVPAIALVKQGRSAEAGRLLEPAIEDLLSRGAVTVILACTELPVALGAIGSSYLDRVIDPTRALARAAVAWSLNS
ncbi:MAG: aspartate/glutamate racemase family protein, partial [Aliidongia sp.]